MRRLSGVSAKQWDRLDASDLNQYTAQSWYPCLVYTQNLVKRMEEAKAKDKKQRKRKRKQETSSTSTSTSTQQPQPHDNSQLAEMISAHIQNMESQLRIIKRLLRNIQ